MGILRTDGLLVGGEYLSSSITSCYPAPDRATNPARKVAKRRMSRHYVAVIFGTLNTRSYFTSRRDNKRYAVPVEPTSHCDERSCGGPPPAPFLGEVEAVELKMISLTPAKRCDFGPAVALRLRLSIWPPVLRAIAKCKKTARRHIENGCATAASEITSRYRVDSQSLSPLVALRCYCAARSHGAYRASKRRFSMG